MVMKALILISLAVFVLGCVSPEPPGPESQDNFNVTVGEEFAIPLASNPSTGYDWTVKHDATMLEYMGYESGLSWNPAPGNQVSREYKFKALKAGNTNITMIYERSPERGFARSDVLKSIEIPVIIR